MLIRICLILAIVAGLAAGYFAHFEVEKKILTLRDDRDTQKTGREKAEKERDDTKAELDKTKMELDTTKTELTTTKGQLDESMRKEQAATDRAKKAADDLAKAKSDNNSLQSEIKEWLAIGKLADVKLWAKERPGLIDERDTLKTENKILEKELSKTRTELAELRGEDIPTPPLPTGLKGKIVQVDPKYGFVVLDIGGNHGVVERGQMLINRNGRLIGKVTISSVMPDKCIANIIKSWKQDEPFEGDEVIY